jgi:type I restriction-modification system DNA methylase subunit
MCQAKGVNARDNPAVTTAASPRKIDVYGIADRLWETADELRANSHLKASEYSIPVLGLIFLKFADSRFTQTEAELAGSGTGRREIGKANYQARSVLYLPEQCRFANLLQLKEGTTSARRSTTRWPPSRRRTGP